MQDLQMSKNQVDEKAASVVTLFSKAVSITNYTLKAAFLSAAAYSIYAHISEIYIILV